MVRESPGQREAQGERVVDERMMGKRCNEMCRRWVDAWVDAGRKFRLSARPGKNQTFLRRANQCVVNTSSAWVRFVGAALRRWRDDGKSRSCPVDKVSRDGAIRPADFPYAPKCFEHISDEQLGRVAQIAATSIRGGNLASPTRCSLTKIGYA